MPRPTDTRTVTLDWPRPSLLLGVGVLWISCWSAAGAAFAQSPSPPSAEGPNQPELVYRGEPLIVSLECDYEDLLNAGMVCNEDSPCRLFLDLVAVGAAGAKLFVLGNIHSSSATVSSILLSSSDQGVTWTEPLDRIRGGSLEQIFFLDALRGWIGGQRWELAADARPFLLLTEDGGAGWQRQDLWEEDNERSGVIAEFDFEDDGRGFLVVERLDSEGDPFELYETMNGGRTWSILSITSDKPAIPIRRLTAEEPSWRLRSDPERGAYAIERLAEGSWTKVVAFAAPVGTCHSTDRGQQQGKSESQRLD